MASLSKQSNETQAKHRRILLELLKKRENQECADCRARNPTWASTNLGVFLCIRCSGLHRQLGVHISKVKSCTMDLWEPHQIAHMARMGNGKAKELYEAMLPDDFGKPSENENNDLVLQWIRSKYEAKRYYKPSDGLNNPNSTKNNGNKGSPLKEMRKKKNIKKTNKGEVGNGDNAFNDNYKNNNQNLSPSSLNSNLDLSEFSTPSSKSTPIDCQLSAFDFIRGGDVEGNIDKDSKDSSFISLSKLNFNVDDLSGLQRIIDSLSASVRRQQIATDDISIKIFEMLNS